MKNLILFLAMILLSNTAKAEEVDCQRTLEKILTASEHYEYINRYSGTEFVIARAIKRLKEDLKACDLDKEYDVYLDNYIE
jgi:hypothetical protein